jgi:hypothetical protein
VQLTGLNRRMPGGHFSEGANITCPKFICHEFYKKSCQLGFHPAKRVVAKDFWRLALPKNILNKCPFFDFSK